MEWMEALKQSVKYMEEHIFDDISVEDVARHVNISSFYLQRGIQYCYRVYYGRISQEQTPVPGSNGSTDYQ